MNSFGRKYNLLFAFQIINCFNPNKIRKIWIYVFIVWFFYIKGSIFYPS